MPRRAAATRATPIIATPVQAGRLRFDADPVLCEPEEDDAAGMAAKESAEATCDADLDTVDPDTTFDKIRGHPFFHPAEAGWDWDAVAAQTAAPPFVPSLPLGETDRSRFEEFSDEEEDDDDAFPYIDDGSGWTEGF